LTTPSSFRLPWVFRCLGQWRFTTFFSWLGTDYHPSHAILSAYRLDYHPFHWLDIGFDHAVTMGGEGARDPDVKTAAGEYVGFLFKSGNSRASSNHLIGFDTTIRVPPLNGIEFYGKVLFEDTNKEADLMYLHNASWLGGIYLPRVGPLDRVSLRGEFIHTGEYAFRHGFYTDGFALGQKLIGYDAGSDTYSGLLGIQYTLNFRESIEAGFRYLWRSGNQYEVVLDATGDQSGITASQRGPAEQHFIFSVAAQKQIHKKVDIRGEVGMDWIQNQQFADANGALDFMTQLKFVFYP